LSSVSDLCPHESSGGRLVTGSLASLTLSIPHI